jgi:hypothetical protein
MRSKKIKDIGMILLKRDGSLPKNCITMTGLTYFKILASNIESDKLLLVHAPLPRGAPFLGGGWQMQRAVAEGVAEFAVYLADGRMSDT